MEEVESGESCLTLEEVEEELPDNAPRYILLSHPIQKNDMLKVPYVMAYYMPTTCNNELRMLYAGAKELMRNSSQAQSIIDIEVKEEFLDNLAVKHLGADSKS